MAPNDEVLEEDDDDSAATTTGCLTYLATLAVALASMGGGIILTILAFFPLVRPPQAGQAFNLAAVSPAFSLLLRGIGVQLLAAFLLRAWQLYRLAMAVIPGMAFLGLMAFLLSLLLFV